MKNKKKIVSLRDETTLNYCFKAFRIIFSILEFDFLSVFSVLEKSIIKLHNFLFQYPLRKSYLMHDSRFAKRRKKRKINFLLRTLH